MTKKVKAKCGHIVKFNLDYKLGFCQECDTLVFKDDLAKVEP